MFYIKLSLYNFIKLYYYFCKVFICNMDIIILRGDFMINENNNLSTNLPTNLKIQLDILATENKTTTDNLYSFVITLTFSNQLMIQQHPNQIQVILAYLK